MRINANAATACNPMVMARKPARPLKRERRLARRIQFAQQLADRVTAVNLGIRHLVEDLDGHDDAAKCK